MSIASGTRLGSYEIVSLLGAGGMGEVYRAKDHELGRAVAIKVLPASLTSDPDRLARFRREAQVLASLNHPHIGQIYGVAEGSAQAGVRGLVLELVEGETLADRLIHGVRAAMRVQEALTTARQIADALDAAHTQGIVHRDLKPANIKVTPAGVVKVLDFGVAKITSRDGVGDVAQAPTMAAGTRAGVIVGTAAYMSPEQARGLAVDKRTDVWAFGCVLYELLTGRCAFEGATATDSLAAVLEREPDWTRLPAETPAGIRRLLQRCLRKDLNERLRDIGDVRLLIDDALGASTEPSPATGAAHGRLLWPWAAGGAVVLLVLAAFVAYLRIGPSDPGETVRMSIAAPGPVTPQLSAAISPDGRHVAFVSTDASGRAMLWVRTLDSLQARALPGTERAAHPFWSPDSRSIGFIADAHVKRVDIAGGPVQTIADAAVRAGPAWGPDGTILFSPRAGELAAVPAAGGPVTTVVTADKSRQQTSTMWPRFLPDGRHFLYFAWSAQPEDRGIYVGSLDSRDTRLILKSDLRAWYAPPGYLVFPRDETLMAQPFDADRLVLSGVPSPIAEGIWFARGAAQASFSVSDTGALAYVNASLWDGELAWFDRGGRPLGSVGPPIRHEGLTPQISPDGRRVAIARGELGREDIWILHTSGGAATRLTFSPDTDGLPVWSADGRRIMFKTGPQIFVKNVDTGSEDMVIEVADRSIDDWSRDGRFVVLEGLDTDLDLWVQPLVGDRAPFRFLDTPFNEAQAQISPNGKWIAYTANESGRDEVYVQTFPAPGRKRQVSTDGGAMPRWRRDGRELFYLAANQSITALPVSDDASLELGAPAPLFRTRLIVAGSESTGLPTTYDVAPDGQRFLLRYPPADPGPPMTVVLNWIAGLKK